MLDEQFKVLTQFMIACYEFKHKKPEELENSLAFFRLNYFYLEFKWIRDCISQNAYHQAIRELRFVLDSVIQAYYVDRRHPTSKMPCKLEIVKEIDDLYGRRLIDETDLTHRNNLKKLYAELCKYVHSSYEELLSLQSRKSNELGTLKFERDPEMISLCQTLVNRTIDAVFFVALSLFPDVWKTRAKFEKMRSGFYQSSKKLGLELTLTK